MLFIYIQWIFSIVIKYIKYLNKHISEHLKFIFAIGHKIKGKINK